jgi:hypothetical protein
MFGIVVAMAVQSVFRLKIHQNKFFIFKKLFLMLTVQNNTKTLKSINFKQK